MNLKQSPNYTFPLIIMFVVCFLIGFVTTMNNSMIEFCTKAFDLNATQGQLVNTAFYGSYILSIPFALLMNKIGYKKTLLWGLLVVGLGFIINSFGIKSNIGSGNVYTIFLLCMCIVAMGVVLLQLVVNPYVMVLGNPEKGAFRMTASQALNSVATTVAPMFITAVIIGSPQPATVETIADETSYPVIQRDSVTQHSVIAAGQLLNNDTKSITYDEAKADTMIATSVLPQPIAKVAQQLEQHNVTNIDEEKYPNSQMEQHLPARVPAPFLGLGIFTLILLVCLTFLKLPAIKEEEQVAETGEAIQYKSSVFKYTHVWLCALGIFMYMGLEIGVPSMLPYYFQKDPSLGNATDFLPLYWGGMMVGRLLGTIVLAKFKPRALLSVCIGAGAVCVGLSFLLPGMYAIYAMLAAGLFHSVMWPLIFNLGLQQLGPHTKAASGVICTGVIGAGPLTMLMGTVVDTPALGVGVAICLMFAYYAYVMWFNWIGSKIGLKKQ